MTGATDTNTDQMMLDAIEAKLAQINDSIARLLNEGIGAERVAQLIGTRTRLSESADKIRARMKGREG